MKWSKSQRLTAAAVAVVLFLFAGYLAMFGDATAWWQAIAGGGLLLGTAISMKANRYKSDERIVYTAGSAVTAGTPVQVVGGKVGIPPRDIAAGGSDEIDVTGRYRAWGPASQAWTVGQLIGWDADGSPLNGTASSGCFTSAQANWDFPVGVCVEAKGATTERGVILLNELLPEGRDLMAPSTVIGATIEQYDSVVKREGHFIKTEILIDLTGAKSVATDKDIIGDTGVCHFGQITSAINGDIVCGQVTCLEVPAGGADDIDFYMASVGTGAYDDDGSALTNAASLITKGGAWALGAPGAATAMTAPITADYYLYLLSGEAAAGTYTAGKFLIELWGLPA